MGHIIRLDFPWDMNVHDLSKELWDHPVNIVHNSKITIDPKDACLVNEEDIQKLWDTLALRLYNSVRCEDPDVGKVYLDHSDNLLHQCRTTIWNPARGYTSIQASGGSTYYSDAKTNIEMKDFTHSHVRTYWELIVDPEKRPDLFHKHVWQRNACHLNTEVDDFCIKDMICVWHHRRDD